MRSRVLLIVVTAVILVAVGAASVYATSQALRAARSAEPAQPQAPAGQGGQPGQAAQPAGPAPGADRGLVVVHVFPDSPAAQAGIRRGAIILAFDRREVNAPEELEAALSQRRPGDMVVLAVLSGDAPAPVSVTLAPAPAQPGAPVRAWLGVNVAGPFVAPGPAAGSQPLNPALFFNETPADHGIGVLGVTPGSPADRAGLRPGDVVTGANDAEFVQLGDFLGLLERSRPGDRLELRVFRGAERLTLSLQLGERPGAPERAYLGVFAWSPVP